MKKFLTVLLALSVVFTYSFSAVGSVFAADAVEGSTPTGLSYEQKLTEATRQLANDLENAKSDTVKKLANEYTENLAKGTVTIPKSVYETIANQVYGDYAKVLEITSYQLKVAYGAADEAGKTALDAKDIATIKADLADTAVLEANSKEYKDMKVGDADTTAEFTALVTSNGQTAYLLDTLKLVFPIEQARVLAELDKIDLTLYTDDIMDPTAAFPVSYAKAAKAAKDELVSSAKKITLDVEDLTADKVKEKIVALQDLISTNKIVKADSYTGLDGVEIILTYKLAGSEFKTKDDLKNDNASLEAAKLAAKAQAQANASEFYKDALNAYNAETDTKADFDAKVAEKDAYLEVELFKIDLATTAPITVTALTAGTANRDLVAKYNALEQAAAAYKLQVEKDGSLKYIAAKIDENLAAAKAKLYGRTGETVKDTDLIVGAENKTEDIAWIKAKAVAAVEAERDAKLAEKTYYDKETEEIKARYALKLAKINACTNEKQVKEVLENEDVDISDVKDAAAVKSAIKALAGYAKELEKVQAHMDQVVNADVNKWSDAYREFTTDDLANFYGEKGARTTAEIQALLADAKAMAAALPSVKEKKDAKAAAEKAVNDIPNRIALTDKAAVEAANKLVETAKEMGQTVSNESRLTAAINAVKALEIKALNDQIAALPALSKVTTADKAAVKAVADALDALYGTDMYGDLSKDTAVNAIAATVENYQKAVRAAVKADVEAKIAALSANAARTDIEAARAAYDAFVEEYTDASEPYDAKAQIVNADKLFYAEAQLKANEIKAVESLKITASSTAKKGSITVKWTVKGDVAAADGYEVFRSVKKNSGFTNKAFYTTDKNTKKSYKNTKSLKKGTRYYYKVRAYKVVDGVKYYSDWSNKAYRVAK